MTQHGPDKEQGVAVGSSLVSFESTWRDIRFAMRSLLKTPGFTVLAILVIAVGIGANTAVFSVINTVLLKPLTYPNPQSLVHLMNTGDQGSALPQRQLQNGTSRASSRHCWRMTCHSRQFSISESTRPSQPFGGRTFKMKAIVRPRSTTSESPYLPALIQLGPYITSGTLVSYAQGDPCVDA